ncbi:protein kinase [Streptosporangium sp. NPDC048865]|uniref:serine/threonine-protein kinase n=1 Tax=Streptosporangium sp. NPDC048865 TaxID=3155766 RepID=UPI0034242DBA
MSHQHGPVWQSQPPARSNTALSVVWALVPLLTCGVGTPFVIGHAARRLRSPLLAVAAAVYGFGVGIFVVIAATYGDSAETPAALDAVGTVGLFGSWLGGLGHALILRGSVFRTWPSQEFRPGPPQGYGHAQGPSYRPGPLSTTNPSAQGQRPHRPEPPHHGGYQPPQPRHDGGSPQYAPHHPQGRFTQGPLTHTPAHTSQGPHAPFAQGGPAHTSSGPQAPYTQGRPAHPSSGPQAPYTQGQPAHPSSGTHVPSYTQGRSARARQDQNAPVPQGWLGPYRLIGSLGKGGQGTVHLALTPQGQKVAIKVLHEHFNGNQMVRERFLREVEATRRVATFSTARVLDVNINEDQAYVVSEYVEGDSLEQLVRDRGPRDEDGLTRLALSTAGALAAIHRAGVVHRDFKPANVLIGADGPRVIDFGIARALDQVTATSGNIMGTPAYMSPEQLSGETVGPETDVFSWAATMIFAASGKVAFGEDTIPAILNRVINHHPDLAALPRSLRPLAAACLDKQPGNRPTAADIMLRIVQ